MADDSRSVKTNQVEPMPRPAAMSASTEIAGPPNYYEAAEALPPYSEEEETVIINGVALPRYDQTSGPETIQALPSYDDATQDYTNNYARDFIANAPSIDKEEAQEALLEAAKRRCCWGTAAAKEIDVGELHKSTSFHYELWSTLEERSTRYVEVPYRGGSVDGAENGFAPLPWEIDAQPPGEFKAGNFKTTVPHTTTVEKCPNCRGTGEARCLSCRGVGNLPDQRNNLHLSSGNYQTQMCMNCSGTGGISNTTCIKCAGCRKIKRSVELTVRWEVRTDHAIDQQTHVANVPDNVLSQASGKELLEHKGNRIGPLRNFPIDSINVNSEQLLNKHHEEFKMTILQKQVVRAFPVTRCDYQWKGEARQFVVFGMEKQVYAPTYPQRFCGCCDGCVII